MRAKERAEQLPVVRHLQVQKLVDDDLHLDKSCVTSGPKVSVPISVRLVLGSSSSARKDSHQWDLKNTRDGRLIRVWLSSRSGFILEPSRTPDEFSQLSV